MLQSLICSGEAEVVLKSIAIRRSDCFCTNTDSHYAANSNLLARHQGIKSYRIFKRHHGLHQLANHVKHDAMPPMPPPPLHDLSQAPWCHELEAQEFAKLSSQPQPYQGVVPFSGQAWNIHAAIFGPSNATEAAQDPASIHCADEVVEQEGNNVFTSCGKVEDVLQYLCSPGGGGDPDKFDNDNSGDSGSGDFPRLEHL